MSILPETDDARQECVERSTLWVSTVGTCERFQSEAELWQLGIRRRGSREYIDLFTVEAPPGSLLSLDDLDLEMFARGYVRSSAWQIGSDAGWVAWLSPVEAVA